LVLYATGGLLSLVGIGAIARMVLARYWSQHDREDDLERVNDGERARAEVSLVGQCFERIEKLEAKVQLLTDEQMSLTRTNAQLVNENEHLKETNQRQAKQIDAQSIEIRDLRRELDEINRRFNALSDQLSSRGGQAVATTKAEHQALRLKKEWNPISSVPVVIVEDDRDTRELLEYSFMSRNVEVKSFDNGMSALDWLSENDVSVILLDLAMPVMDGLTIAKNIRLNEGLSIGRVPAQIAFYSGQEPDAVVALNKHEYDIRGVFVKGKDDPLKVVEAVTGWLK
jgi:CheY-like chemotaxis protein